METLLWMVVILLAFIALPTILNLLMVAFLAVCAIAALIVAFVWTIVEGAMKASYTNCQLR